MKMLLLILITLIISCSSSQYVFDGKNCRDKKTGKFVINNKCSK